RPTGGPPGPGEMGAGVSIPFRIAEAEKWSEGVLASGSLETQLSGVSIDTRTIGPGELFVAIRGERHDAHGFLDRATQSGAAALLVERSWLQENVAPKGPAVIAAEDTTLALGALAHGHRSDFGGPLVAVTGSNGKTSTKELTHSILSVSHPCLKNEGNLNNEFGLPLTLLRRESEHRAVVLELGMNHRGEIARLTEIARPDVGVITNVGSAHIEFLGSQEEIALEKGDLVAGLGESGTAVLNADDARVLNQRNRARGQVLTFGHSSGADVRADQIRFDTEGAFDFLLGAPQGSVSVRVPGWAETTVDNSLAAAAAALSAGASLEEVKQGLTFFEAVPGRMNCTRLTDGARVIDDSYNANPQSMRVALETLARVKGRGRAIAVLGDMGELGAESARAHVGVGSLAGELGTDLLFALGDHAEDLGRAAVAAGMAEPSVHVGGQHEEIAQQIASRVKSDDWILVKGSRAMQMERVVQSLVSGGGN
ncbi:MAG: UDP-N-acetylmuramoyl-tripeptide--D-alanyl-D-alanine ligase, partial [Myxococcota bacterium]